MIRFQTARNSMRNENDMMLHHMGRMTNSLCGMWAYMMRIYKHVKVNTDHGPYVIKLYYDGDLVKTI